MLVFTPFSENDVTLDFVLCYHHDPGVAPVRSAKAQLIDRPTSRQSHRCLVGTRPTISFLLPQKSHPTSRLSPRTSNPAHPVAGPTQSHHPFLITIITLRLPFLRLSLRARIHSRLRSPSHRVTCTSFSGASSMTSDSTTLPDAPPGYRPSYERTYDRYVIRQSSSGANQSWE